MLMKMCTPTIYDPSLEMGNGFVLLPVSGDDY